MTRVFDVVEGRQENATPQGTPPSEAVLSARNEEDGSVRSLEYGGRRVAEGQRGSRSSNDAHYHQIVIARLQLAQGHGD